MTMQSSGQITLSEIAAEFGGSAPHSLSEYYDADTGVPASGVISFSDFYGTSAYTPSAQYWTSSSTYTIHSSETSFQYKISGGGGGGGGCQCSSGACNGGAGGDTTLKFKDSGGSVLATLTAEGGAGGARGGGHGSNNHFNNSGWPDPPWNDTTHSFFNDGRSDGGHGAHGNSNCNQGTPGDAGTGVTGTYTTPSGATSITITIGTGGADGGQGDGGYLAHDGWSGAAWILGVQS